MKFWAAALAAGFVACAPAAALPFEGWFADPLGWCVAARGVRACGVNGFAWSPLPCARRVAFSARVTPEKIESRAAWLVCGVSIGTDDDNRWSLQFVRSPDAQGARRYIEFFEVREGQARTEKADGLVARASTGENLIWEEGVSYTCALTLDDAGVTAAVKDAAGRLVWSRGWDFGQAPAVRSGAPALRAHTGITVSFTELEAETSDVCGGLAGRPKARAAAPYRAVDILRAQAAPATGFFRVDRAPGGGRWRFIDPLGNETFLRGVDHVKYRGHETSCVQPPRSYYREWNDAHYPSVAAWAAETVSRLRAWGFNLLGGDPSPELLGRGLPSVMNLNAGKTLALPGRARDLVISDEFPNVFHPDFPRWCDYWATVRCAPERDNPWLVGYFLDNELDWGTHGPVATCLYDRALALPEAHSARQAAEAFARARGVKDPALAPEAVRHAFVKLAAEKYFSLLAGAVRRHDPNHLVLGVRFAGLPSAHPAVWEVCGKYCDVVSVNCYPWVDLNCGEVYTCRGRDAERVGDVFGRLSARAGKPLMVTEWSFPALDSGVPSTCGCGQRFRTQAERARATAIFARTMMALPCVVGYDYFMWVDQPPEGMRPNFGENSNYGLVSEKGEVYRELAGALTAAHACVAEIREKGWRPQAQRPAPEAAETAAAFVISRAIVPAKGLDLAEKRWRWTNKAGMALSGRIGPGAPIERVTLAGAELGSFNAMAQVAHAGRWCYWVAQRVVSVRTDATGALVVRVQGGQGEGTFEMDLRVLLDENRPAFLVELLALRNPGASPLVCANVMLHQYAPFAADNPLDPPDLWGAPYAAAWIAPDGRWFGAGTCAVDVRRFRYWAPHPDAVYAPVPAGSGLLTLAAGAETTFDGRVWQLCAGGREGARPGFVRCLVKDFALPAE